MIGLFKQKTPANILFLFVFGILIKLPLFTNTPLPQLRNEDTFLYQELVNFMRSQLNGGQSFFAVLTYLLLFTQSMQLNRLISNNRMMQRLNYLPAMSYLMITSLLPEWNYFSAPLILNSIILIVFSGIFGLYNQYNIKATIFNISLLVGVGSFLFSPSLVLIVWLLFSLMVMRTIRLNEALICLLGVTMPYYFYAAWLFFYDTWSWDKLIKPITIALPIPGQSAWLAAGGFLLLVPFLIGGYFVQENLRKMLIQVRKNWSLMLIYLLFALCIPFLDNSAPGFENWILVTVPFAAFHACTYLYPPQRWLPSAIFILSVAFIIVYQYWGPGW